MICWYVMNWVPCIWCIVHKLYVSSQVTECWLLKSNGKWPSKSHACLSAVISALKGNLAMYSICCYVPNWWDVLWFWRPAIIHWCFTVSVLCGSPDDTCPHHTSCTWTIFFLILMHNKCGSRVWRKEMASDRWLILSCVTCLCKTGHAQGSPWMMWTPCPFSKVLHKGKCEVCESFWSRSCLELSCPSEKSFLSASASDVLSSNFIILSLKSA